MRRGWLTRVVTLVAAVTATGIALSADAGSADNSSEDVRGAVVEVTDGPLYTAILDPDSLEGS